MARKLKGGAIQANTITTTQLVTTVVNQIQAGASGGPKVSSITYPNNQTATVNTGNESIVLTGTGFEANVQVYVNGSAVPSVSRTNANSLSFTTPALTTGTTYPLYVVNPDGGTAVVIPGMVVSSGPVWVTASPLSAWGVSSALSRTLVATSDSTVSYSLAAGSSLPSGISLAANGLLSGTLTSPPGVDTTYNFTVVATDLETQKSSKAFSITASLSPTFNISPAVSGITTWDTSINGALILDTYGTWTITPNQSMNANVVMWGAGGGGATGSGDGSTVPHRGMRGGGGGSANGFITLAAGQSFVVRVGRGGRGANTATVTSYYADVGGGGAGYADGNWGTGSGGAYTGIFAGSETQANAIMIAGGGGGAGLTRNSNNNSGGGAGGGTTAQEGFHDGNSTSPFAGDGGTQAGGGAGGSGSSGYGTGGSGTALVGGTVSGPSTLIGSGGGSGYYGGGAGTYGGGDNIGGGGGGSGFANSSLTSGVTLYTGDKFNPGNNTHPYFANSGVGGTGNLRSNLDSTYGANGRFVLISAVAA